MGPDEQKLRAEARKLDAFLSSQGKPALAKTLLTIVIVLVAVWQAWSWAFPSGTWRYRITVVVETPEGIKTGSAVREVRVEKGLGLFPEMSPHVEVKGEAVVVDLGQRGILFTMMSGDYGWHIVFDAFPMRGPLTSKGIRFYSRLKDVRKTLSPKQYPTFVRFRNLNDPKTIENVRRLDDMEQIRKEDPHRPIISYEDAFGEGVRVKEVIVEMTSEPVNWGVERYLPWY